MAELRSKLKGHLVAELDGGDGAAGIKETARCLTGSRPDLDDSASRAQAAPGLQEFVDPIRISRSTEIVRGHVLAKQAPTGPVLLE